MGARIEQAKTGEGFDRQKPSRESDCEAPPPGFQARARRWLSGCPLSCCVKKYSPTTAKSTSVRRFSSTTPLPAASKHHAVALGIIDPKSEIVAPVTCSRRGEVLRHAMDSRRLVAENGRTIARQEIEGVTMLCKSLSFG